MPKYIPLLSHHKTADFTHELLIMFKKNTERIFYALIEKYRKEGRFIFIESLCDLAKTHYVAKILKQCFACFFFLFNLFPFVSVKWWGSLNGTFFWFLQELWHIKTKMCAMQNKYAALSHISSEDWFLNWSCFYESSESSSKPKKKKKKRVPRHGISSLPDAISRSTNWTGESY